MSQFGEYLGLWKKLKADKRICVKPTGCTIDQLRRALSKEKDEDEDLNVKFLRIKKSEKLTPEGIGTGYYYIDLVAIENKTRATTVAKILKNMEVN